MVVMWSIIWLTDVPFFGRPLLVFLLVGLPSNDFYEKCLHS